MYYIIKHLHCCSQAKHEFQGYKYSAGVPPPSASNFLRILCAGWLTWAVIQCVSFGNCCLKTNTVPAFSSIKGIRQFLTNLPSSVAFGFWPSCSFSPLSLLALVLPFFFLRRYFFQPSMRCTHFSNGAFVFRRWMSLMAPLLCLPVNRLLKCLLPITPWLP